MNNMGWCRETGLTPKQIIAGEIPKASVRWPFKMGQPLVLPELVKELPTQMYKLHEWYMKKSNNDMTMVAIKIRDDDYFCGEDLIWLEFLELYQLYQQDALDIYILTCWVL